MESARQHRPQNAHVPPIPGVLKANALFPPKATLYQMMRRRGLRLCVDCLWREGETAAWQEAVANLLRPFTSLTMQEVACLGERRFRVQESSKPMLRFSPATPALRTRRLAPDGP